MTHAVRHHIAVGGRPYCNFTGCIAGMKIADQTSVHTRGQSSGCAARAAAKALRTELLCVVVVSGPCPKGNPTRA